TSPRSRTTCSTRASVRQRLIARPLCPAPMISVSTCLMARSIRGWRGEDGVVAVPGRGCPSRERAHARRAAPGSRGLDLDLDRHLVGDDVEHGRAGAGLLDDRAEGLRRGVAPDAEVHADALVPVPDLVRESEQPLEIDAPLDAGLDLLQRHAARGREVSDPGPPT